MSAPMPGDVLLGGPASGLRRAAVLGLAGGLALALGPVRDLRARALLASELRRAAPSAQAVGRALHQDDDQLVRLALEAWARLHPAQASRLMDQASSRATPALRRLAPPLLRRRGDPAARRALERIQVLRSVTE